MGINTCAHMISNFMTFHLGPALAFNMNRYGTSTKAREKTDILFSHGLIRKNQAVMCAFGEIDCRVHVLRHAEKRGGDFRPVVDDIAANYSEFLKYAAREHPVYVWGAVPSQKDTDPVNPDFPRYGTEIQRNLATEYFNLRMKAVCEENGFKFFSIFDKLIDSSYRTKAEYIADGCHLSQKAWEFASEEFRRQGIEIKFSHEWAEMSGLRNTQGRIRRKINLITAILRYYYTDILTFRRLMKSL